MKTQAALPPVRKSGRLSPDAILTNAASGRKTCRSGQPQHPAARIPATSWLAWGLSLIALILAFIFPSYGNGSTDPLYMLQCLPSMVFGCTAAILFIQGLAALRR